MKWWEVVLLVAIGWIVVSVLVGLFLGKVLFPGRRTY